jgi:hypothetical protein
MNQQSAKSRNAGCRFGKIERMQKNFSEGE